MDVDSEAPPLTSKVTSRTSSSDSETQNGTRNERAEVSKDPEKAATQAPTGTVGAVEPAHLKAAFESSPELPMAWHDAKAFREPFATP
jgi:hypothetical protein